jgi:hypothetical protein
MRHRLSTLGRAGVLVLVGCGPAGSGDTGAGTPGTSGTNTGLGCVESDLIAQCPPGSNPDLSAEAVSSCEGQADFLLSGDGGSIDAACRGSGECLVVCNFQVPCTCGVDAITAEGVFCTPCLESAACGDAVCEGGEDATTCPVDCAAACPAGSRRCNGRDREDCNMQGQWERVACRPDQACEVGPAGTACQANLSPAGGTYAGTGWAEVRLPHDPAEVYFPEAEIGCGSTPGGCLPLAFLDDGTLLGTNAGSLAVLSTTGAQPQSLPVPLAGFTPAVSLPWVAAPARQPVFYRVDDQRTRTAEAVVDDVTDLVWGSVAAHAGTERAAVGFAAAGQPFVALYDLSSGRIVSMLRYAESDLVGAAVSLAFSHDGSLLAELRPEGLCIVWNVAEGRHVRLVEMESESTGRPGGATTVAFSPTGPLLVLSGTSRAEIWDLDGPVRVAVTGRDRGDGFAGAFALSPDGRVVLASDLRFGAQSLFYLESLEFVRTVSGLSSVALTGAPPGVFSPDGRRIAVGHLVYGAWVE